MKLFLLAALFLAAIYTVTGEVGRRCVSQSECTDPNECCQIINMLVASKKRQFAGMALNEIGTCQRYDQEGEHCDSIMVMNGECGCAEGLQCRTLYEGSSTVGPGGKRGAMMPGYVQRCVTAP